ncbi:MAG: gliding motility protein GldC [Saprospiraceae bacterium]|nr:gliding motility protein GldC [Saprospiraceae bacterium]
MRQEEINIKVTLDEDKQPHSLAWQATSGDGGKAKAMLLSFFDNEKLDTLKIDLWTTDFQIMEMDRFMFQTLSALADTYQRATQNNELASQLKEFSLHFGEKTGTLKPRENS